MKWRVHVIQSIRGRRRGAGMLDSYYDRALRSHTNTHHPLFSSEGLRDHVTAGLCMRITRWLLWHQVFLEELAGRPGWPACVHPQKRKTKWQAELPSLSFRIFLKTQLPPNTQTHTILFCVVWTNSSQSTLVPFPLSDDYKSGTTMDFFPFESLVSQKHHTHWDNLI